MVYLTVFLGQSILFWLLYLYSITWNQLFPTQVRLQHRFCDCLNSCIRLTRMVRTTFISRISFSALTGEQTKTQGLCSSLGAQTSPEWAWNSLVRWAHSFCSVDQGSHGLCSLSATVCRAIEWTTYLPMCSGLLPWLDRFKGVFSKLDFLPGWSSRSSSRTSRALFHVLSWPTPQVPWLNRTTIFALQTISSIRPSLHSSASGPPCF